MKKIIALITILSILVLTVLTGYTYAAVLDDFAISVDKKTVRPGEQVVLKVTFGQPLGSFKVKVDFDDDIFEYVSADNGTGSAESDTVTVEYTELSTTKTETNITFKAKTGITTSNPTEFTVTATNMKSEGGSTGYDDITEGKVETLTVEPEYQDYTLTLENAEDIIAGKEIPFKLSYSSPMGRHYAKARLEADATKTPENATVKLIGFSTQDNSQYDIIDDGWGNAQGYAIGGEDVSQELDLKGIFSQAGEYTITLKLIDREKSDETIVEKAFNFTVKEAEAQQVPEPQKPAEELPEELPKTGVNETIPVIAVFTTSLIAFIYIAKKHENV